MNRLPRGRQRRLVCGQHAAAVCDRQAGEGNDAADPCRLARQVSLVSEKRRVLNLFGTPASRAPVGRAGEEVVSRGRIVATIEFFTGRTRRQGSSDLREVVPSLKRLVHRPGKLAGVAGILRQLLVRRPFAMLPSLGRTLGPTRRPRRGPSQPHVTLRLSGRRPATDRSSPPARTSSCESTRSARPNSG